MPFTQMLSNMKNTFKANMLGGSAFVRESLDKARISAGAGADLTFGQKAMAIGKGIADEGLSSTMRPKAYAGMRRAYDRGGMERAATYLRRTGSGQMDRSMVRNLSLAPLGGAALGAGASMASGDGHMGRDAAIGGLAGAAGGVGWANARHEGTFLNSVTRASKAAWAGRLG
jgi:hypothetical protein